MILFCRRYPKKRAQNFVEKNQRPASNFSVGNQREMDTNEKPRIASWFTIQPKFKFEISNFNSFTQLQNITNLVDLGHFL